ncbi:MAG: DUF1016 family protein [Campylobacterales bacterium]|nr:DUF1016 family protein [Campylobacterales bacterium]
MINFQNKAAKAALFRGFNYFKKEEATEGDNEPVGIILGAYKNHILVEYATDSIENKILLAKYQLYLPDKTQLEKALNKIIEGQ